ncbi:hypothetical protein Vadar_027112 [Vaccinium darrowii]|uniref:Uncharacterized protein n=1 Tax=Vaccinium darrowii TaxID=229202 RepID=A0ACB7YAF0_9ERIC|nr:hypothetical protein Vadar_027112 [Vaccinium darrowii]
MQAAVSSSVTFVCQIYSANPGRGSGQHLPSMLRFYACCCTVGGKSIMLRGCSGFSSYGIFEHQEGCPDVNIYQGSIVFKLEERL